MGELLTYAFERLGTCRLSDNKPTCVKYKIHCFKAKMRAPIREVMRHLGLRMLGHHLPIAPLHFFDGFKHFLGK